MATTTTNPSAARERYIYTFADWFHADFVNERCGKTPVPPYRVSFGKAPGMRESRKFKVLGVCMARRVSSDEHNEIFLDITGDKVSTVEVLATFIHEYIHAIDDCMSGHGGAFAKMARALGLAGPLTATVAGDELRELLEWYVSENGDLPAGAIKAAGRKPKQSTRMMKVECDDHACGFHFRTSRAQIDKLGHGAPCPACGNGKLL